MRRRPARDAPETLRGNMQIKVVARAREAPLCFQNHSPNREIMGAESHPCVSALQQASGWCGHPHSVPYSHSLTHVMAGATVRRPWRCAAKLLSTSVCREKAKALSALEVLPDPTEHRREPPTSSHVSRTVREASIRSIGYLPVDSLDQCKIDR
ncbi:hypothetical protein EAH_00067530 [Eimeria acervulina]|uniref:Uncharacterized protein n=1 Tax=Eimeria acervulina TaxID=5801 RepID=U6GW21_EIMAC|nr:hypothetical protein EAH_00067530 [Eimeria acervulina]CDI82744.1 hypothetical protein EAH_00067530 [Eimeria acervulina]